MDNVNTYIAGVFAGINDTPEVIEQKQELAADLGAHIEDLVKEGHTEAEAFGIATSAIGQLDDLVEEYRSAQRKAEEDAQRAAEEKQAKQKQKILPLFPQVNIAALDLHTIAGASVIGLIVAVFAIPVSSGYGYNPFPGMALSFIVTFLLIGFFVYKWHKTRDKRSDISYDLRRQMLFRVFIAGAIALGFIFLTWIDSDLTTLIPLVCGIAAFLISEPYIGAKILGRGWFQPHPERETEER